MSYNKRFTELFFPIFLFHSFILVNGEQAFIDLEQQTQGRSSQRFHQYSNRMNGSIQSEPYLFVNLLEEAYWFFSIFYHLSH